MIKVTQELLQHFELDQPDYTIVSAYVDAICRNGTREDATILFDFFLKEPTSFYRANLLKPLLVHGDSTDIHQILDCCFDNGVLKRNYPEAILHLLGYLGHQDAVDLLLHHAFKIKDHYLNQQAVMGLIHLDCSHALELIEGQIKDCFGKNLFPEFTPALVCKLANQKEVLKQLYELGSTTASTDCNGGLILGFSLCGDLGKEYFMKAYRNEHWECFGGGTGTDWWTYLGLQNLGIRFEELYHELKTTTDDKQLGHLLRIFAAVLEYRLTLTYQPFKFTTAPSEGYKDLYKLLFSWETPNKANNILDLAEKVKMSDKFYRLKKLLIFRMESEMMNLV